ncbi:MAG: GNAT family N-acetyltransferase [Verrucomicrobiota bacterium]|nr:GNAT family N-acetyltransferase [Verrucomicrobiota bacterium]
MTAAERTIPFRNGVLRLATLATLKQSDAWREAFAGKAKDHRFYEIVEETLRQDFEHRYLVYEDGDGKVRGVQPVFFLRQNLVEGMPALRAPVEFVRRFFPAFLTMRTLMIGNAAGSGYLGNCRNSDEAWLASALGETLLPYARSAKASLVVCKDFAPEYRNSLGILSAHGFTRIPSMPVTRLDLTYGSFDDYFAHLSKATRKDLRRKFRRVEQAEPIEMEVVNDVTPFIDEVYPLYLAVHERSSMKFETLTKEFLCALGERMPDRARFMIWRQGGRIIAFTIALVHNGVFYDDYLGLDYRVALDLHLYFVTFRDIIRWCIEQGLTTYVSSPLNYEPKLHLDCLLGPLDLYVLHTSPLLRPIFRRVLPLMAPTRHDPVLHRFPNAHEL